MDVVALSRRVEELQHSIRRLRAAAIGLAVGVSLLFLLGFTMADEIRAQRLVLTGGDGTPRVVLTAGPESSLVIQAPDGRELMRLGTPAARPIRH